MGDTPAFVYRHLTALGSVRHHPSSLQRIVWIDATGGTF
jgi:hypothetical protein